MSRAEDLGNRMLGSLVALVIGLMGTGMAWDGLERGRLYAEVDAGTIFTLVVDRKEARQKWLGNDLRAIGWIKENGDRADVQVFNPQYGLLERGNQVEALRLAPERPEYVSRAKYRESWPVINLGILAFSWHLPVGAAMIAVAWHLAAALRRSRADSPP